MPMMSTKKFAVKIKTLPILRQKFLPFILGISAIVIATSQANPALAAGKATVEITATELKDKKIELSFTTKAATGLVINTDGPWKLSIKDAGTIKLDKMEYKREDWNEKNATFTAAGVPSAKKTSEINYKMIVFVCTKEKSQCFREVVEGPTTVTWK